jgi:transcriptional regulator with XRE-family HTH domain
MGKRAAEVLEAATARDDARVGGPGVQEGGGSALHTVGGRLKRLRKLRGLTLEELATAVGMSHSFLSMLERGLADVSLGRLERLAAYYGISLAELLMDEGLHAQPDITASEDGRAVDRGPGVTYRLFPERAYLGLQLIHIELAGNARFTDFLTHKGYDVLFVCRGTVVLLHATERYVLTAGTLASYSASAPHALANEGRAPAEVFAVTTPPYW